MQEHQASQQQHQARVAGHLGVVAGDDGEAAQHVGDAHAAPGQLVLPGLGGGEGRLGPAPRLVLQGADGTAGRGADPWPGGAWVGADMEDIYGWFTICVPTA